MCFSVVGNESAAVFIQRCRKGAVFSGSCAFNAVSLKSFIVPHKSNCHIKSQRAVAIFMADIPTVSMVMQSGTSTPPLHNL